MLKKQQPLEDHALTEPDTPPPFEPNSTGSPHNNSQLIQRIISSNEELIHQQMVTIRELQRSNYELEEKLKAITDKYDTLVEFALGQGQNNGNSMDNTTLQTHPQNQLKTSKKQQKNSIEEMLQKIVRLEQQLSTTKVELAVKSAELLTTNFQHNHEDSANKRRQTITSDSSQRSIEKYRYQIPTQNESMTPKRPNSQNKELVENWNKVYLQYGAQDQKGHRFKQKSSTLIKKFIPKELRGKIWPICIENRLGMTNALYIQLLERREKGWVCEKVRVQIDKDIKRSFYGKTHYETKTGIILEVVQFLEIFHIFRPDVSYIQGMTYPAMILIPILGKIKAFNLFCNLVLGSSFFRKLFSMEGNFISTLCRGFELLLEEYLPDLARRFTQMSIQSEIYLIEWLFTFFSRGLSIETTLKFWDHLVFFEEVAIFRMCLAVFEQLGPIILELNFEEAINFIREYSHNIKEDKLLEGLVSSKLTSEKLYKAFEKVKI